MSTSRSERVLAEAERLVGGPLTGRRLEAVASALGALHRRFVSPSPAESGQPYLSDPETVAAYLSWFFPASAAQAERAMAEVSPPAGERLRLLDIGSGPGPASVGVARWAASHGRKVEALALEAASDALESFKRIWSFGPLETRCWRVGEPLPDGPFEVIVASHVLNELFWDGSDHLKRRTVFCKELLKRLAPGGLLVLLEPALRRTGRDLLVVRDALLAEDGVSVRAPCLVSSACPALERSRDWCHADRPWSPPEWSLAVGKRAGIARDSLKFSYVIFSNTPLAKTPHDELFRIVSEPMPEKGKKRFFGCGPLGRHALVRLDRDRSETNATFDVLERGDIVKLGAHSKSGDGLRVGPATGIDRVLEARTLDGFKERP